MRALLSSILPLTALSLAACATKPARPTTPVQYTCGEITVDRAGTGLTIGSPDHATSLGWHDDAGDHFVSWPLSPTDTRAVEFVMPADPRLDGTQHIYDTSLGASTADWRLVEHQVCTARGGYNDVLSRWMKGATMEQIAAELSLDGRDGARSLIHQALVTLQRRYRSSK
ncbi:MAG: hypothetical protein IPQ07_40330 [Myxococcales bacterium]|nr:hypothetical protein [Myxococcales bacterium]